jgi:hypothetical protein
MNGGNTIDDILRIVFPPFMVSDAAAKRRRADAALRRRVGVCGVRAALGDLCASVANT